MKTIEIIVSPDGKASVQTKGFAGSSCREASRLLEGALGIPTSEKLTADFYQAQPNSIGQSQHQRF
jgi:hypothetical protein